MRKILDTINKANDIKNIDSKDYKKLASEIRQFIIRNVSKTGGHFASNLGVIELTMALHLVLDFPKDKHPEKLKIIKEKTIKFTKKNIFLFITIHYHLFLL